MRLGIAALLLAGCVFLGLASSFGATADEGFWAPLYPPRAHYKIDCRIDPATGNVEGTETIRLKNRSGRDIKRIVLSWASNDANTLAVKASGVELAPVGSWEHNALDSWPVNSPLANSAFDLPHALAPGDTQEITVAFSTKTSKAADGKTQLLTHWHPRLYWGFETHDDFDVKVDLPPDCVLLTSGRLDQKSGRYRSKDTRQFGIAYGKGLQIDAALAGDVLVQCLHTEKGAECAQLLLTTAVDVINFYRERFGVYPYSVLSIVPGADYPMGGCPVATSIVMVHGEEQMKEKNEVHWQRITAHEIGHQYWSEWVMGEDLPAWFKYNSLDSLMVGLGVYADREYCRARSIDYDYTGNLKAYASSIRKGDDSTIDLSGEQLLDIEPDFHNQIVVHAKGYCLISALANVLGREVFERAYRNCLKDYRGRRMSLRDFQAECETQCGQDLAWFFEQWARSNAFPAYEVTSKTTSKDGDRYLTRVEIKRLGTLRMPIPVAASFEDGTRQVTRTDRLLDLNVLHFESKAPLKDVVLDPEHELALVSAPLPPAKTSILQEIEKLKWTGEDDKRVLAFFADAKSTHPAQFRPWFKLGLVLYDTRHYTEALEAFEQVTSLRTSHPVIRFGAYAWQGHLLDLMGRRDEALRAYQQAIKIDIGSAAMKHSQYGMIIDKKWVEERLKMPFERK